MKKTNIHKLVFAAVLVALAVVGSLISFPIGASKCAPVQHLVNIIGAVFLGPAWAVGVGFTAALLRNLLGLGSLLAFPGSMVGAFVAGMLYKYIKKLPAAYVGELFGTSVLGGLLAYPVARFLVGAPAAAITVYISYLVCCFRTAFNYSAHYALTSFEKPRKLSNTFAFLRAVTITIARTVPPAQLTKKGRI